MPTTATDQSAQQRAQSALAASPIYHLRDLQVEQEGNTLYLHGRVVSYYHKQLAQEAVRSLSQGIQVVNSVVVDFDE